MMMIERFFSRLFERAGKLPAYRIERADIYKMMEIEADLTRDFSRPAPTIEGLAEKFGKNSLLDIDILSSNRILKSNSDILLFLKTQSESFTKENVSNLKKILKTDSIEPWDLHYLLEKNFQNKHNPKLNYSCD